MRVRGVNLFFRRNVCLCASVKILYILRLTSTYEAFKINNSDSGTSVKVKSVSEEAHTHLLH